MDSLISTFHIDWKLMVAQLINFVVVIIVLWLFALKPLKKLMDERGATIAGGLENAEKQRNLLIEATQVLENGRIELNKLAVEENKKLKAQLEKQEVEATAKTKEIVDKIFADGKKQLEVEKNKVLEMAEKEVGSLLLALAEKAFGDNMDEKLRAKLVEEGINGIK